MKCVTRRLRGALVVCMLCTLVAVFAAIARPAPAGTASTSTSPRVARPGLTWVYALYVDADDSLDYAWVKYSLRFLSAVHSSPAVKVVALIDRRGASGVSLAEFDGGRMKVVARWPEKDVGSAATLRWFISQIHARYPSQHLALNVWDHGYAWRGFAFDQTSGHEITLPGLAAAIRGAGVPIDVLAFDACNMADAGVVYQAGMTGLVHYVVASEETINEVGFPYDRFLKPLIADPGRTPAQLAASIVKAFNAYYHNRPGGPRATLGAVDARAVLAARTDMAAWTNALRAGMGRLAPTYQAAVQASMFAKDSDEIDLGDLLVQLSVQPGIGARVQNTSRRLLADLRAAVLVVHNGPRVGPFTGLTMWLPPAGGWGAEGEAYCGQVALASAGGWASFLGRFRTNG